MLRLQANGLRERRRKKCVAKHHARKRADGGLGERTKEMRASIALGATGKTGNREHSRRSIESGYVAPSAHSVYATYATAPLHAFLMFANIHLLERFFASIGRLSAALFQLCRSASSLERATQNAFPRTSRGGVLCVRAYKCLRLCKAANLRKEIILEINTSSRSCRLLTFQEVQLTQKLILSPQKSISFWSTVSPSFL